MGALSFKERFCDPVVTGVFSNLDGKTQSIRNFRARPLVVGEWIALYYAQRSPQCKWLAESVIKSRQVVRIDKKEVTVYDELSNNKLKFANAYTSEMAMNEFAIADGFTDIDDMHRFWYNEHGNNCYPYKGNLYKWFKLGELEAYEQAGKITDIVLDKYIERLASFMAFHTADPAKQLSTFLKEVNSHHE